jgi:hypothetical protein
MIGAIMRLTCPGARLTARLLSLALTFAALAATPWAPAQDALAAANAANAAEDYSFIATADMRNYVDKAPAGKRYFDGLCEELKGIGPGAFMISPGDCDPPGPVRAAIDRYLGTNYIWYPIIGNHELGDKANVAWLQRWAKAGIPGLVSCGPAGFESTTFSFDYANSHFVALNEYCAGSSETTRKDGLSSATLDWLEKDLAANKKPLVWISGHVPIKSLPDMDSNRLRHEDGRLTSSPADMERFLNLLKQYKVRAYICGHTHGTSVAKVKGIWQADCGHARGAGDKGAASTLLKFRISGERSWADIYRADANGMNYKLRKSVELN